MVVLLLLLMLLVLVLCCQGRLLEGKKGGENLVDREEEGNRVVMVTYI